MRIDLVSCVELLYSIDHTVSFYDDSAVLTPSLFPVALLTIIDLQYTFPRLDQ